MADMLMAGGPSHDVPQWRHIHGFQYVCCICFEPTGSATISRGRYPGKVYQKCAADANHGMWIDGVTADQVPIFNQERASGNNIYQVEQTFSQPQPSTAAPTTMMQNGTFYGSQYQPNQIPATQPLGRPQARMRINCSCGAPGNVRCISSSCKACCQRAAVAWGGNSCQAQDHQKNNRIALQQKGWVPPPSSQPSSSHYPNLSLPNQLRYPTSFPSQQPSSTLATLASRHGRSRWVELVKNL
ncbi:hypothetical protein M408DRAFT_297311 [Serendipita vermifera MAFF 305830]|uniref:Uncharacterized protein n=1 Tax=Serendipita vermifera MAFF 305830 TaxID=933852 RepID=A0A0C2XN02_SERVB|nr:hypothetical protein M408DRAFT_297311 [Serendipita vermifera MAFF 305830]